MLSIREYDINNNYRKLNNDPFLFHNALKHVLKGESRFHVEDEHYPFDLVYQDNDMLTKKDPFFPQSDFFFSELFFPPYYFYDENDTERINLSLLKGFQEIFFEEVNEYTIVLASLAAKHTRMQISFSDEKVRLFPWIGKKVHIEKRPRKEKVLYVQKDFYPIYTNKDRFCTLGLFHSMFLLQWLSDLPKEKIKYLSVSIRKTEGIGSILSTYSRIKQAFDPLGIQVFIEPGSTRFSQRLLSKYFLLNPIPEDSTEENTVYVKCFNSFVLNYFIQNRPGAISLDMLQQDFVKQMKEYADAIIGKRKILGVLLRGTDYIIANFAGSYHTPSIEDSIRFIKKRMKQEHYEKIFLASEDALFLEKMFEAFPGKVLTTSQERHRVSDFSNLKYISDLEKRLHSGEDYEYSVEDTTVNYFYAAYLLSRCDSFISNCMCSGVNIVTSFNKGKFRRVEIISEALNKKH